jgi:protein-S-isoprenylcysteine O-methyltransferase Ste14
MSGFWRTWGAGPKWGLVSAPYLAAAIAAHVVAYPRFVISRVPYPALVIAGSLLTATGVCIYVAAAVELRKGIRKGRLVTTGLYSFVRHPLYAAGIFFITPGVALLSQSWLLVPMPLLMYVGFRIFVPAEDKALLERFGDAFGEYRDKTNPMFPRLGRKRGSALLPEER